MKSVLFGAVFFTLFHLSAQQNVFYYQLRQNAILINPALGCADKKAEFLVNRSLLFRGFSDFSQNFYTIQNIGLSSQLLTNNDPDFLSISGAVPIVINKRQVGSLQLNYGLNHINFETDEYVKKGLVLNIIENNKHSLRIGMNYSRIKKTLDGNRMTKLFPFDNNIPVKTVTDIQPSMDNSLAFFNKRYNYFLGISMANSNAPDFQYTNSKQELFIIKTRKEIRYFAGIDHKNIFGDSNSRILNSVLITRTVNQHDPDIRFPFNFYLNSTFRYRNLWDLGINMKISAPGYNAFGIHTAVDVFNLFKRTGKKSNSIRVGALMNIYTRPMDFQSIGTQVNFEFNTQFLF